MSREHLVRILGNPWFFGGLIAAAALAWLVAR